MLPFPPYPPFEKKPWWSIYSDYFDRLTLAVRRRESALGWARKLILHLEQLTPNLRNRILDLEGTRESGLQRRRFLALVTTCLCAARVPPPSCYSHACVEQFVHSSWTAMDVIMTSLARTSSIYGGEGAEQNRYV
jgi:hypothetical protein